MSVSVTTDANRSTASQLADLARSMPAIEPSSLEETGFRDGRTLLVVSDLYPSKEALDAAIASGSTGAFPEQFEELDTLLTTLGAGTAG